MTTPFERESRYRFLGSGEYLGLLDLYSLGLPLRTSRPEIILNPWCMKLPFLGWLYAREFLELLQLDDRAFKTQIQQWFLQWNRFDTVDLKVTRENTPASYAPDERSPPAQVDKRLTPFVAPMKRGDVKPSVDIWSALKRDLEENGVSTTFEPRVPSMWDLGAVRHPLSSGVRMPDDVHVSGSPDEVQIRDAYIEGYVDGAQLDEPVTDSDAAEYAADSWTDAKAARPFKHLHCPPGFYYRPETRDYAPRPTPFRLRPWAPPKREPGYLKPKPQFTEEQRHEMAEFVKEFGPALAADFGFFRTSTHYDPADDAVTIHFTDVPGWAGSFDTLNDTVIFTIDDITGLDTLSEAQPATAGPVLDLFGHPIDPAADLRRSHREMLANLIEARDHWAEVGRDPEAALAKLNRLIEQAEGL